MKKNCKMHIKFIYVLIIFFSGNSSNFNYHRNNSSRYYSELEIIYKKPIQMDFFVTPFKQFKRSLLTAVVDNIIKVVMVVAYASAIWNSAILLINYDKPLFIVSYNDMRPTLYRGSLVLVMNNWDRTFSLGDIILLDDREHIEALRVRRIVGQQQSQNGVLYMTKADASPVDDRWIYPRKQSLTTSQAIVGRVWFHIPYLGQALPIQTKLGLKVGFFLLFMLFVVIDDDY